MLNKALFSSAKGDWGTPPELFRMLNDEFHFNCDVAASAENALCEKCYTETDSAFFHNWDGVCFCNPPYGREVGRWVEKALREARAGRATTVMLLPARTDTRWFHEYIWPYRQVEVRFIKSRLKFVGAKNSAPFPSMVCIFRTSIPISAYAGGGSDGEV